jgi:hypothetical protein
MPLSLQGLCFLHPWEMRFPIAFGVSDRRLKDLRSLARPARNANSAPKVNS